MAITKQKGKTKVAARKKTSAPKVGAGTKRTPPKVKHTSSHLRPSTPKKGGNKAGVVHVGQDICVVEYPGERSRGGGFKGIKTVDSRG